MLFLCNEHCYSIAIMVSQKQRVSEEDTSPVGTHCAVKGNLKKKLKNVRTHTCLQATIDKKQSMVA